MNILVLPGTPTKKMELNSSKLSNAVLPCLSPTDGRNTSTCYNTWNGAVLKTDIKMLILSWCIKISNEKLAITKKKYRLKPLLKQSCYMHFSSLIIRLCIKTPQRQEYFSFIRYVTSHSYELLRWNMPCCCLLHQILIFSIYVKPLT